MKIVAILQNQWFRDPESVKRMLARQPDDARRAQFRKRLIHYSLFAGCLTGRRLKAAFGELTETIHWEEASREIGGHAAAKFPPDPEHIAAVITEQKPDIVLAFGTIAASGVMASLHLLHGRRRFQVICASHPAARGAATVPSLNAAAADVRRLLAEVPASAPTP